MATRALNEKNFESTVNAGIVLVDWWASWCGPCRAFAPIFEKAADAHPDIIFGKVNTEEAPQLASAFGIQAIPTLMVFRDGILVFSQPGVLPGAALEKLIAAVEALDMEKVRADLAKRPTKAA